ncbi:hypothetical protein MKI84_04185 [Ancylobacter sp. A5.8]|uniref:hypothetical protein n=1 Tax=Ancylobacter gelatini TaxID=2919920 RepID=UPI001F4E4093|nr:hypothetical protein [Ancylobacter gelatini]MCJ8142107.1 hypothetical protein [Ancylobacter gelatini]
MMPLFRTGSSRRHGGRGPVLASLTACALSALCFGLSQVAMPQPAFAQGQSTTPAEAAPAPAPSTEAAPPAYAGPYVFGSPPSAQANRLYSVNARTGEVSACQFERPEGSLIGLTKCFPRDASAGPAGEGSYDIVSTRYSGETGIFRVNVETGEMSVCYVRDMPRPNGGAEAVVVCTPGAR